MSGKIEKSHEKLLTTWYPAILNIFYQGSQKKEWTSIPNDRLESFFRTVSLLLADQIRHIVRHTALDFLAIFDTASLQNYPGLENARGVSFTMKMVLDEARIRLDPSVIDIQGTIEALLDSIFVAADSIPNIETQLFTTAQIPISANKVGLNPVKADQCIKVAFEETYPEFVADTRRILRMRVSKLLEAPVIYMGEFDRHKSLIGTGSEIDVTEFLSVDRTQDAMMEEVKRYRNVASNQILAAYPFVMHFPMVELQCADFITNLSERAVGLSIRIVEKMGASNRALNAEIIKSFEAMAKSIATVPANVEEMVALQTYIDTTRSVTIKTLEEQVEEAKKK